MLVITRKAGQSVLIGDAKVTVTKLRNGSVRLGIEAPRSVRVVREEIKEPKK